MTSGSATRTARGPALEKIVINMGVGEATQDKKRSRRLPPRCRRFPAEAGDHQGEEVDRSVQAARRHADRLQGHPAPRAHVRVPRPSGHDRAPARPRLQGPQPKSFDGRGNYAMGLKEQIIFPEINYDRIEKVRGMDIIITTTARTDDEARELLRLFNFPFPRTDEDQKQAA
jgi:large subunit ribosomal protein L5